MAIVSNHTEIFYHSQLEGVLKPTTHLKVFFRKSLSDAAYTLAQVFTFESQLSQTERGSSILECFHSQTVTCYWPVRNTRCHGPEFHGHNTAHNN